MGRTSNDVIVLIGLCALLLCVASWRHRPVERRPPALHLSAEICVSEVEGSLRVADCSDAGAWPIDARAPERLRRALGWSPCWWTAGSDDFSRLSGVGPATGERLTAYRDAGGLPAADALQEVHGVGASLAQRVAEGVARACGPCWRADDHANTHRLLEACTGATDPLLRFR